MSPSVKRERSITTSLFQTGQGICCKTVREKTNVSSSKVFRREVFTYCIQRAWYRQLFPQPPKCQPESSAAAETTLYSSVVESQDLYVAVSMFQYLSERSFGVPALGTSFTPLKIFIFDPGKLYRSIRVQRGKQKCAATCLFEKVDTIFHSLRRPISTCGVFLEGSKRVCRSFLE